jgi:hypothetical protein
MKLQWPAFLVGRHSLASNPSRPGTKTARRRVPPMRAKQEFPRLAILTRRRPLPKGH